MSQCLRLKIFYLPALFVVLHLVSFSQGKIIMNGATMKMVRGAYVSARDITIKSGAVIVDSSTIKIAGSINNTGVFDLKKGTLEMNGVTPQVIPANSITNNILKNLIASNNFSLAGQDSVTGVLSFGGSNRAFNTAGFLTLKSTAAATARVADITNAGANSGNTISGNVKVERFISATRAWRFLTAPIQANGAQTIQQAWQEGVANSGLTYSENLNPVPGFGTHIPGSNALGFDKAINGNTSLKIFQPSTGAWVYINTTNRPITDSAGYMLFFRGDRSVDLNQGTFIVPTTSVLRSTGSLKTNDQTFAVAATGFTVIGNPYASPMDLNQISKLNSTNVQDNFYLWDPKLSGSGGVGGYVNVSYGEGYDITPNTGGSGLNQYVQSGSAFLVRSANGASPGILIIKEKDKTQVSFTANRPPNSSTSKLRTNLYAVNADGTGSLVDGTLNSYGVIYANNVDKDDAVKIKNVSESLSTQRDGIYLVVERKQPVLEEDTIFFNMVQMKVKAYKFDFSADNFNPGGLTAFLEDSYFNTSTVINLEGKTTFNFNVINAPGSWNPNRFRIVFKQTAALPLTFINAKAYELSGNIQVEWKAENETNIKQYDVEKIGNSRQFIKIKTVAAKVPGSGTNRYNWLDENAAEGDNYYRIKSISLNGETKYSRVLKVNIRHYSGIVLNTNVIRGNTITFQMNNMPAGSYAVSITNNLGQLMYQKKIEHAGGNSMQSLVLNQNAATGIYHLNIIKPDLSSLTIKMLVE